MNDIVLEATVVNIEPQTEVLVDAVSDAEAVVLDAVVRLENNEFVLSSGGMYGGGELIGSIPAWVLEAVSQRLTTGDGNLAGLVNDLQTALNALEAGVHQSISNLESDVLSQSGLITGLRSDVDGNNATIMNVLATKVTDTEATALALNAIQSTFGADVEAFVSNIASTYVDADSAIATEIDMMQASLNGVNASITDISSITIETVQNPLWVDDGIGTDPDINDEPRWIDQAKAKKQLQVNADGVITGILLESGQTSSITMQADEFKLVATGQDVASRNPFTVNATTGDITFIGKVSFNSVTDTQDIVTGSNFNTIANATSTTIDGSRIATGYISANRIAANSISADKISAVNINGYTIEGAIIKGANIVGSVIKSSWIDYTTTGDLTNWQFYTPATIPTAYASNFAHDNTTGALIVDSLGYVRLAGLTSLYSDFISYSSSSPGSLLSNDGVCSYDAYTTPSTKRCVASAPRIYSEGNPVIISIASTYNGSYYGVPVEYVQFSLFGDTIKVTHVSGGTGFAYWSQATVYKNGIEIARATYATNDEYASSVSFSVNSINFIIEDAFTGAVLKLGVNTNIQLQTFIGQKAYIFGDFSWYISGAGVRFATISMPSIRYT